VIAQRSGLSPALVWALGTLTALLVVAAALLPSVIYVYVNGVDLLGSRASASAIGSPSIVSNPVPRVTPQGSAVVHWRDVHPIFAAHCVGCHSNLGAYERALRVGAIPAGGLLTGATVITPGDPAASILFQALVGKQALGDPMPYRAASLSKPEISAIEAWIRSGAQA
jgi:mono/diheme cytochrome c family protein